MFGQPALVAAHGRGDAQREAFLAQQRIADVARAEGPDFARLGEMHDVLVLPVARPRDILLAGCQRRADRMQAGNELALRAEHVEHLAAHARHDAHRHRDIGGIGNFHADMRDARSQRAHAEGDHVHRAAAHASREQPAQRGAHFVGRDPVVGRSGVGLVAAANKGAILDARHVAGIRAGEIAIAAFFRIEAFQCSGGDHLIAQIVVFPLGSVTPVDPLRLRQARNLGDPAL